MRLLSELRVPFDHIGSHVAPTGAAFGFGVAYLLFLLMFLSSTLADLGSVGEGIFHALPDMARNFDTISARP